MKRFFAALGKAAVYLLVLVLCQLVIPVIYLLAVCIVRMPDLLAANDPDLLFTELLTTFTDQTAAILLLANGFCILIYLLTAPIRRHSLRSHLYLHPMTSAGILPLVLLGIFCNFATSLVLSLIPFPDAWWDAYEASAALLPMDMALLPMLAISVIGPIAEEFAFRGLIYTRLRGGMPDVAAAILSALIFGAMHGTWIWFVYASCLGLLLVWVFRRYGSLWASILVHVSYNLSGLLLSEVPEHWASAFTVFSILCCAAVVAILFWIAKQTKAFSHP